MTDHKRNASSETVTHQLNLVTRAELANLADYAHRRLLRVGLNTVAGEDVVQDALQAVLVGLKGKGKGRHPRECDVASKGSFKAYLGGVINSLVTVERHKHFYSVKHHSITSTWAEELEDGKCIHELASPESITAEVAISDLQSAFFTRFWPRVCPAMKPHVREWEADWPRADQIPVPTPQRRLRGKIKILAQEILAEMGEELAA